MRFALGSPQRPLTLEERLRKARQCLAPGLGPRRADELIDRIARLEQVRNAREIGALLVPEGEAE